MASPENDHKDGLTNEAFDQLDKDLSKMSNDKDDDDRTPGNDTISSSFDDNKAGSSVDKTTPDKSETLEEIHNQLGGYGRYQMLLFVIIGTIYMRGGWQIWVSTFQALDIEHHCMSSPNLSINESVPRHCDNSTCTWDECYQYVNISIDNRTQKCQNGWTYTFDASYTSIVSEYDLVCDDSYLKDLTSTLYMVGAAVGVLFLSQLADVFGAKKVMLACLWSQAVFGTCIIWSGNVIVFCVLKFFIGVTNMTIALCSYVLMTETFDTAHRELPAIAMQFFWALGIMSMALFGYLIPNWQDLQLTITLPINVLSIIYIFVIPEPLPWLLSRGRTGQAERVIKRFIKVNKLQKIPDLKNKLSVFELDNKEKNVAGKQLYSNPGYDVSENITTNTNAKDKKHFDERSTQETSGGDNDRAPVYNILTLFKTRKMRINTFLMFYVFMVNSLAYYGIMFNTPVLNGDRFLNLFILGVVEVPAYILCMISNKIIGRRRSIAIFLFICAVSNLAVLFIPDTSDDGADLTKLKTALVIIGKFGITGSYSTIYLYASEVFPTVVRNQAVGASSVFDNIGSIAAPNMVYVNNSLNDLPLGIFGGLTILGSGLVLLLPETHNRLLPQTIEDIEQGYGSMKDRTVVIEAET